MKTAMGLLFCLLSIGLFLTSCEQQTTDLPSSELEIQSELTTYFALKGNTIRDLDFPPQSIQPRTTSFGSFSLPVEGIEGVSFKGAVAPNSRPWYANWSFYDRVIHGGMSQAIDDLPVEVVSDNGGEGTGTTTWTNDKIWVLDGVVFINRGDVLTIEPGTVIQGREGIGRRASALVVARGGKIIAEGDTSRPIIFTYEGDKGETDPTVRGKWGGLILLGDAVINSDLGTNSVEGLSPADNRAYFGGNNDEDNSGVLRYVSIRHSGSKFGIDNNEINGLTLGAVGSKTIIEKVEVVGTLDDGFEWFGGTVNCKNIIAAYCGDDALDYDLGYRGKNQFVIVQQDETVGDKGGEHSGGDNATALPYSAPVFFNVTSIGRPASKAVLFNNNAGGEYHNSIFMNYGEGVEIEYVENSQFHSFRQFQEGNLKIENNIFFNIQSGTLPQDLLKVNFK
ncbi:MAG: carboxypeptidase regulatory-like domain-containing protein [Bacteroidota bacterium]